MNEKKRHPSNIIFNLIALALLLTVIVFLHQILKKPKSAEQSQVKSVAALPSAENKKEIGAQAKAEVSLPAQPPVQVTLPAEQKPQPAEAKEAAPAEQTVVELPQPKIAKVKTTKKSSYRAEEEISPAELDGEEARQKYIRENKKLSSGDAKVEKSSTAPAPTTSAESDLNREASRRFEATSRYDLDDETARQKYLDENRRFSKAGGTSEKPKQTSVRQSQDEYIPFEDR